MIMRVVYAVVVAVVVGLACILLGVLLNALGVPPATAVGGFLTAYAWVIGALAGLLYFLRGGLSF
jgi:hypothetical protein